MDSNPIVDANGNPVAKEEKKPHQFGVFIIPEDARLSFRNDSTLTPTSEYPYVPNMYAWIGIEHKKTRA